MEIKRNEISNNLAISEQQTLAIIDLLLLQLLDEMTIWT